jgi:hypothetical protein
MNKKIISIDAETDGLWGKPFSVAAIVYQDGKEVAKIILKRPDECVSNEWVRENVLPALKNVDVTHEAYEDMLDSFASFYFKHKKDAKIICHMGYIVEAFLFREMRELGIIGDWDAPYPLIDISGHLEMAGEDATSVDAYAKKHDLIVSDYGSTHNPLYDCEVAARVYMHIMR